MVGAELVDATGNRSASQITAGCLCIYEPAWILRMRLATPPDAVDFSQADTWTLKDIPVPKNGNASAVPGSGTIHNVTLSSVSLAVAAHVKYTPTAPPRATGPLTGSWDTPSLSSGGYSSEGWVESTQPQVGVCAAGLRSDQKLTIWATDRAGNRYNLLSEYAFTLTGNTGAVPVHVQTITISRKVRMVDLHFAVLDIKTVDFMVRPPLPGTETKSN